MIVAQEADKTRQEKRETRRQENKKITSGMTDAREHTNAPPPPPAHTHTQIPAKAKQQKQTHPHTPSCRQLRPCRLPAPPS